MYEPETRQFWKNRIAELRILSESNSAYERRLKKALKRFKDFKRKLKDEKS